jgi:acyl-CoA thioester hydrolase
MSKHHPRAPHRDEFVSFTTIPLRWHDNDYYGHVNNVVYYTFFDTVINQLLIEAGVLDLETSTIVGFVVETRCTYFSSLTYPGKAEIGVAIAHLGRTSARYRIGVFAEGVGARGGRRRIHAGLCRARRAEAGRYSGRRASFSGDFA